MQYRKFGKLDFEVSALGFGCMRFPTKMNEFGTKEVDMEQTINMLRYAIDNGLNYLDTAYVYHDEQSESILGKALKNGYRDKVKIATKVPPWNLETAEDFNTILNKQLKKLQTDRIDLYLFHAVNKKTWQDKILKLDLLNQVENAKRAGKIEYIGFSFHDEFDVLTTIIDSYNKWDFCQLQYNYLDINYQAGMKGIKYAAEKCLAVVVMEPLLGGALSNVPKIVGEIFEKANTIRTPTDWALQWLWNQPEVSVVLSGMNNMQQIVQNLDSADKSGVGKMTSEDLQIVEEAREKYQELRSIPCTQCKYCLPCPVGIDIPYIFQMFIERYNYNEKSIKRKSYNYLMDGYIKKIVRMCISCKSCENKCPQKINISSWMNRIYHYYSLPAHIKFLQNTNIIDDNRTR